VAAVKEIKFNQQPNGITIGCYLFMDSHTFDSAEARECRGIAFDAEGRVVSRPLHKFFNLGEKAWLSEAALRARPLAAVFEKLDGSMLATAWVDGKLAWRSKKAFHSDVVGLTQEFLARPENGNLVEFATEVARAGMTAIFELTHPAARIVVGHNEPQLRLLHIRDNLTGEYLLLDPEHPVHGLMRAHAVEQIPRLPLTLDDVLASLPDMTEQEGYVLQFADGDMVKVKCPWYLRLHRSITFLRERDIAALALSEELDDVKAMLTEIGIDLSLVEHVEARAKTALLALDEDIEGLVKAGAGLDRKSFALKFKDHPLFGLAMQRYLGKEVALRDWYARNRLKEEFSLKVLASAAQAEAMAG
jgi:RNA ligase